VYKKKKAVVMSKCYEKERESRRMNKSRCINSHIREGITTEEE